MGEYRIDELARESGTTVRNIRAYQDRGLLPPPRREGRAGVYTDVHLARLRLIGQLLERGYTLGNIAELLAGWEGGRDLGAVLGLEQAVSGPWSDEVATYVSLDEVVALFGADADALQAAVDLGFLVPEGERFRVPSPRMLHAGAELFAAGVPLDAILEHGRALRRDVDRIAKRFVQLMEDHVFADYAQGVVTTEELPRIAELVRRLRPLAEMVVDAELARAMQHHATAMLGDQLTELLDERETG